MQYDAVEESRSNVVRCSDRCQTAMTVGGQFTDTFIPMRNDVLLSLVCTRYDTHCQSLLLLGDSHVMWNILQSAHLCMQRSVYVMYYIRKSRTCHILLDVHFMYYAAYLSCTQLTRVKNFKWLFAAALAYSDLL